MAFDAYQAKINELKMLRDNIDTRIEELREEAGIEVDFEDELQAILAELCVIIKNRSENEDVHALWDILQELHAHSKNIMSALSGLGGY